MAGLDPAISLRAGKDARIKSAHDDTDDTYAASHPVTPTKVTGPA
jgi:hypothetical protein